MENSAVLRVLAALPSSAMGPVQAVRGVSAVGSRAGDIRLLPDTAEISPEARARYQASQGESQASRPKT